MTAPNLDALPSDILLSDRAVVWKYETRDAKPTKVPYMAHRPQQRAAVDDPRTWSPFSVAVDAVLDGKADGVGIVLGSGLVGIDLDHCRNIETGAIDPFAQSLVNGLDSYTEVSPSGTGLHIWVRGEFAVKGRRRQGIEIAISAQHPPHRGRRGQVEAIAERRVTALRLRKAGASYRAIAEQLTVDVATAHADVKAELAALREQTVEEAKELRDLELQRFDEMTAGLWPQVQKGSPPAVCAAIRVSERRARLVGLDEPSASRTEISGSLSLTVQARLKAEAEELRWLSFDELKALAEASDKLISDAIALVKARRTPMLVSAVSAPVADVNDVAKGEPAEQSPSTDVDDA